MHHCANLCCEFNKASFMFGSTSRSPLRGHAAAAVLAVAALDPAGVAFAQECDTLVGALRVHITSFEDTLPELARRYGVGYTQLAAANPGVDPWLPGAGTEILVPTASLLPDAPRAGIVVNLAELRIYRFGSDGRVEATYPIGIGRQGFTTPLGSTTVVRRQKDPVWFPTESARMDNPVLPTAVPPGPDNPLGSHALYLGWPSYLLHGTNKPWGIGRRVSRGCLRLYPEDIASLYASVAIGTPVTVVHQPVKTGWHEGRLYLEIHPSEAQSERIENGERPGFEAIADLAGIVQAAAGMHAARLDWSVIEQAQIERRGIPVAVTPFVGS